MRAKGGERVFISYARQDSILAAELANALRGVGFDPWLYAEQLRPGDRWLSEVEKALENAEFVVAIITPHSSKSEMVQRELEHALVANRYIVPVYAGESLDDSDSILPWILKRVRRVSLESAADSTDLDGAARQIRTALEEFNTARPVS